MMDKVLLKYREQLLSAGFNNSEQSSADEVIRLVPTLEDSNENITDPFSQLSEKDDHVFDHYSTLEDRLYSHGCRILTKWLEETLRLSRSRLKCRLMAPADLCSNIAADVLSKAEHEPAGIRGCVIHLMYCPDSNNNNNNNNNSNSKNTKSNLKHLAEIVCDHTSVCTFELTVTLYRDKDFWLNLRTQLPFFNRKSSTNKDTIILTSNYETLMNKLYRSSSEDR